MSTLDELELEMYRSEKDVDEAAHFGYDDEFIVAKLHYEEASKMFYDAQTRQYEGKAVGNRKTKKWLKSCREMRAAV